MISIETIQEGRKYRIFVSGGTDDQGKRVRVTERFAGTKTEANKRARAIAGALDSGAYVARGPETFAGFVSAWWPSKASAIAATTARTYRGLLDQHILPAIGRRPIQKITAAEVGAVFRPLVTAGHLQTADHVFVVLRIVFNAALRRGVIGRSPLTGVERPKVARRELTILSPDDWRRVHEHLEARDSWALRPLSLLLTLGCRRSELCGLQWRDVDLERRIVFVRRAYHAIGGPEGIYQEPKSQRSRRAIALDSHSVDVLAAQRADADKLAGMFGRSVRPTDPVFARADGRAWRPDSFTKVWRRITAALSLKVRLHDLRHSSATLMLAAGVPIQLVSARLGHATPGFTLTTYAGILPGAQAEAAEKLAALLKGHQKPPVTALAGTTPAGVSGTTFGTTPQPQGHR